MTYHAINFAHKLSLFREHWQPKVIAEMNDYQFKLVRIHGDFIWHDHKETDETFIVLEGVLRLDFCDGAVQLSPGEMFVVPRGVQHKPYAASALPRATSGCDCRKPIKSGVEANWLRRG
jgi:mannose-6-phosphate isomerase-like protein (cupin superfamily)